MNNAGYFDLVKNVQPSTLTNLNDLRVNGTMSVNNIDVSGSTTLNNLIVDGSSKLSNLDVSGNVNIKGYLEVGANITATGQVFQQSLMIPNRENRSQVTMVGKDYDNTNYQASTDGCGNILPFFNTGAQGQGVNNSVQSNITHFGAFTVTGIPGVLGNQQTFQGVCDRDYVYFIWEIGQINSYLTTGTNIGIWQGSIGNFGDWPETSSLLVKVDRNNGQIVLAMPIGLMMDNAYLAAGKTTEEQAAVGPGVYQSLDSSGNPTKDSSGNIVTIPVNGNNKNVAGYVGFQTTDIRTWEGCGDDQCRGPMQLYEDPVLGNVLYITGFSQKYASVYKVKCNNFSLVWRRTVDSLYQVYAGNDAATMANRAMRQVIVIPPRDGRPNPIIVTGTTDNFAYSTIDIIDLAKLFNYYIAGGSVQAWTDFGTFAGKTPTDPSFMWQTLIGPTPFIADTSTIPDTIFRRAPLDSPMLTIDGITEKQDPDGFILDLDNNVSIDIYYPLTDGYIFTKGDPASPLQSGCKTSGTFNLLTGRKYVSFTYPLIEILYAAEYPGVPSGQYYELEMAHFTFPDGTVFSKSETYSGVIQNGPSPGTTVTVTGQDILNGIPDLSGNYFPDQLTPQFQPVIRKIYKAQVGRVMDSYEVSELSIYGGGTYLNLAYDVDTDVLITPTGQLVHACAGIDELYNRCMVTDVSCNGVFYPGINTPYTVRNPKVTDPDDPNYYIYNTYTNKSGQKVTTKTFYGAGRTYFKGLDSSNTFIPYKAYDYNFIKKNTYSNYCKGALLNYFAGPVVDLRYNADSSGFPLYDMYTNPRVYNPGSDSSGIETQYAQSVYINSRLKSYWDKAIMLRDNLNYGTLYNRQGACGFTGIKVSNGELMFSIDANGYDTCDHSYSEFDTTGGHSPIGVFKSAGYNQDGCSATIVRGLTDINGNKRKLLVCSTKSRLFMLDFNLLIDPSGNQKTLTHVPGDEDDIFYEKGIQTNTWKKALLYEDTFGTNSGICVFNGYGTDANAGGNNFIFNFTQCNGSFVYANIVNCNIPGKEVHGLDMDPLCNSPGYWVKPLGIYEPLLGPDSNPRGAPTGGATDKQLNTISNLVFFSGLVYGRDSPEYKAALNQLILAGLTQYSGKINNKRDGFENGSYNAQGSYKTNCYNLQTILDNSITNPSLNTPENVLKYQFMDSDGFGSRFNNQGTQIYGPLVFSGNSNGIVELFDINTGFPVNQANPAPGQFVPNARNSTIGIYNPEGQRVIPLIADGILYGYGGNNKWNTNRAGTAQNCFPSRIFMWTPYGK